jgi:hypothetical protein
LTHGQTSLVSEKRVGEMGRIFIDGPNKILITYKKPKKLNDILLIRHA